MDFSYKVQGSDGKEYGPVTFEQISYWLREKRIGAESQVMRSDMSHWAAARDFTELQPALPVAAPANIAAAAAAARAAAVNPALAGQLKGGGSWFYWIAGLSLVNSIVALSGESFHFILGLGITQVFDGFGQTAGASGKLIALVLDIATAGLFALFGFFAIKRHLWAFITGMIFFGLDGLLCLLFKDWLSFGFHIFALFGIFRGFAAARTLNKA